MAMPMNLALVRHGESEGNVASRFSKKGDNRFFTEEFRNRHSSKWRLTDKGKNQAKKAGEWIKANIAKKFNRYYVSEYLRAMETAALLDFPDAVWYTEFYLRERDWGELDVMTEEERRTKFSSAMKKKEFDSFYFTPPGGESMAQLCLRIDRIFNTLHRECDGKNVVIVCHGDVMWAFRVRLERMSQSLYHYLDSSENPFDHIHNSQIIHYTRCNPINDAISPHLDYKMSVCPWDLSRSLNKWERIDRPRYSADDLWRIAEETPRLIIGEE